MKHCTGFTDTWVRWKTFYSWEVMDLGKLCEVHDKECSSHKFWNLLIENKVVFGRAIGVAAVVACWVKYPAHMKDRL